MIVFFERTSGGWIVNSVFNNLAVVALWCSLISLFQYIYLWKCLLLYIIRASSDVPPEAIDNHWDFWWAILYLLSFTNITHTHKHTCFLNPVEPSTLMCVVQGGDSQRWWCRHEGTQAISICLWTPAFSCVSVHVSFPLWHLQQFTIWPIWSVFWKLAKQFVISYFKEIYKFQQKSIVVF